MASHQEQASFAHRANQVWYQIVLLMTFHDQKGLEGVCTCKCLELEDATITEHDLDI